MATSLLMLLDDIASLLDDVSVMSKVAAKKTAGVLGDDLALNAQQVAGVHAERELPVVWAVAKGSMINKLILVPLALLISALLPWLINPLLMLGGLYAAGFLLIIGASSLVDGGTFASVYLGQTPMTRELAEEPEFQSAMWLSMCLYLPLSLAFWHAPAVALRTGAGAAKALFVSITASTRNIGAFVVYGLAWLGADLMMSALLGALVGLLGLGAIGMVLVLPAVLLFSAGFHVSMQASVDGCIEFED